MNEQQVALLLLMGVVYLIPGIVASMRGHRNRLAIWALDVLVGWTVLGWIVALIWALTSHVAPRPDSHEKPVM